MDWGFAEVEDACGNTYIIACFAMICNCRTCLSGCFMLIYMGIPECGMNDSLFEQIQCAAGYLNLDLNAQEMAQFSVARGFSEENIQAVAEMLAHLQQKKKESIISTLLRLSRLSLKKPKTFENFDFGQLHGRQTDADMARKAVWSIAWVKPSCLIIDKVERCVFDKENTRMFFDIINRKYNKEGSNTMIFTSNKGPDMWGEFFNEDSSLLFALDRIFDDTTVFMIKGTVIAAKTVKR